MGSDELTELIELEELLLLDELLKIPVELIEELLSESMLSVEVLGDGALDPPQAVNRARILPSMAMGFNINLPFQESDNT